jgi:chromosome partitioning protein
MALANADLALADLRGRERRLRDALAPVRADYAAVVVDCPPSLSLLVVNALVAADAFLVPVVPQYLALEGLVNLLSAVAQMRQALGVQARMLGVALTMVDRRTRLAAEVIEMVRAHYTSQVFTAEVPTSVRLAEAPSHGQTIFQYAPGSPGAAAYRQLAAEVLHRARAGGKEGMKDVKKEGRR